jgi:hypothetical protein
MGKPEEKGGGTGEAVEDSRKDPGHSSVCIISLLLDQFVSVLV